MISENQESIKVEVQPSEEEKIEKLKIDLNKKKQRVITLEQKISFRQKGGSGKYTSELIKARTEVQDIVNRIILLKRIEDDKITEAFLKDYEERDKINKEKARVQSLFNEYKENTITKPEFKPTPKPDFSEVGAKWKKERNLHEKLKIAQKAFDMAKTRMEKSSPVGKGAKASVLQIARNALNSALKSVEKEDGNIEFYNLRAELEWKATIIVETEEYLLEVQAYIDKKEADFALFEKHGLLKPEIKT